ncbi:MAG: N-acetylmuramoyl-L-alanine amidase [Lachnospiraceae bacterium]|nr:N-acetylmuramoyl-L-alanine amidase [Lachnospiraceae bacterium]
MAKEIVIVIDPGHGGTEGEATDGASYHGITERHINMTTAKAMYEELSSYDGVTVYLTHDSADTKMSLKERAEFAKSVNADYLISIHYNASEEHLYYGSEVWIPSTGLHYAEGYQLGSIILEEFSHMGLLNRGVKTKVNESGSDYYGVIRECEKLGINGIIVEHCYLDHDNDSSYRDEEEDYVGFGIADATSVAKFLGLSSSETGADYSNYVNVEVPIPETVMYQDLTPPNQCVIQLENEPQETGVIDLVIRAYDEDSALLYYSYSLDGGNTFSHLIPWMETKKEHVTHVRLSDITDSEVNIVVKVYNQYNLDTSSEPLFVSFSMDEDKNQLENNELKQNEAGNNAMENTKDFKEQETISTEVSSIKKAESFSLTSNIPIPSIIAIVLFFVLMVVMTLKIVFKKRRHKR